MTDISAALAAALDQHAQPNASASARDREGAPLPRPAGTMVTAASEQAIVPGGQISRNRRAAGP